MSRIRRPRWFHFLLPALTLGTQLTCAFASDAPGPTAARRAPTDARALAAGDSVRKYCARVKPDSLSVLERERQKREQGIPPDELARMRQSADYRAAASAEDDFLGLVDPRNAGRVCPGPTAKVQ